MFALAATILIAFANGKMKNDCSKIKMPKEMMKHRTDNKHDELQTWDHQHLDHFYIYPEQPNNAVIRIKEFANTQCNKANVKFFIKNKVDKALVTIHDFDYDEIIFTVNPLSEDELMAKLGDNYEKKCRFEVTFKDDITYEIPITFRKAEFYITDRSKSKTEISFKLHATQEVIDQIGVQVRAPPAKKDLLNKVVIAEIATKSKTDEDVWDVKYAYEDDKEYWFHSKQNDLTLPGYYAVVPLRWTQSKNGHFKDINGDAKEYDHYQNHKLVLNSDYWHVIQFQVLGAGANDIESVKALKYWKDEEETILKSGREGKLFNDLECGAEHFENKCQGKVKGAAVNGFIELKAKFKVDGKKKATTSFVLYKVEGKEVLGKMVYLTEKKLGEKASEGKKKWPIVLTNEYKFGTNDVLAKDANKVKMPSVKGMPFRFQINCVGGNCGKREDLRFVVGSKEEMANDNTQKACEFTDRKAKVVTKWAGLNEKYGFYALITLDKEDKSTIKTVTISANPWQAVDDLRFKVMNGDAVVIAFEAVVTEWHGAPKFWVGLIALMTIIALQAVSCVYMAKKNAAKKKE